MLTFRSRETMAEEVYREEVYGVCESFVFELGAVEVGGCLE